MFKDKANSPWKHTICSKKQMETLFIQCSTNGFLSKQRKGFGSGSGSVNIRSKFNPPDSRKFYVRIQSDLEQHHWFNFSLKPIDTENYFVKIYFF